MKIFHKNFSLILFSALLGFLVANIFGTFLTVLRNYAIWDGFIIVGLLIFVETTNLTVYKMSKSLSLFFLRGQPGNSKVTENTGIGGPQKKGLLRFSKENLCLVIFYNLFRLGRGFQKLLPFQLITPSQKKDLLICPLINSFKLGLLLGFFVEAFKVGS